MLLYKNGYQQTFNSTLPDRQWNPSPIQRSSANSSLTGVSLKPDAPRGDKSRVHENTPLNVERTHTQCGENTHSMWREHTLNVERTHHSMWREHITQCRENTPLNVERTHYSMYTHHSMWREHTTQCRESTHSMGSV